MFEMVLYKANSLLCDDLHSSKMLLNYNNIDQFFAILIIDNGLFTLKLSDYL